MNFITSILKYLRLYHYGILFTSNGYLKKTGWIKSFINNKPSDENGVPIPWMTYPFIEFLEKRLHKKLSIFEYGGGNSTIWFADRVGKIVSVENDEKWVEHINKFLPENALLHYRNTNNISYSELSFAPLGNPSEYSKTILENSEKYDIIIIDGVDRNNCIVNSLNNIMEGGIIVIDNYEFKEKMQEAISILKKDNYKILEFWGLSPMIFNKSCTAVFYKSNNCLDI